VHISRSKCGAQVCGANIELLIKEGCKQVVLPKTNTEFWQTKIARNRERDQRNYDELTHAGWQVIVLWQCKLTKQKLETTMQSVAVALNKNLLNIIK
jgi:DNA mismatch endonuclease (patch repair protein)